MPRPSDQPIGRLKRRRLHPRSELVRRARRLGQRRQGFTLAEILLVLAVLVAAAAVVLPDVSGWQSRWTLRNASRSIQSDLQLARTRAIETGETFVVRLELKGTRYSILAESHVSSRMPSTRPNNPGLVELREIERTLPEFCRFASDSGESRRDQPQIVRFQPDGTADAARIRLTNDSGSSLVLQVDRLTGACQAIDGD